MNVKIIEIFDFNVLCETKFGKITLAWNGVLPQINQQYEVELDADEILEENINIFLSDEDVSMFDFNNKKIIIGDLESIDDDGYTILRIENQILPLWSKNIEKFINKRVKIYLKNIYAYPINYYIPIKININ